MNYRKIWINKFGEIPKDENGITYEIHHIDGNSKNNNIENLQCLSIKEHFDVHYLQNDWYACKLIAERLNIDPVIRKEILKEAGRKISIALKGRKFPKNSERYKKLSETLKGRKRPDQSERLRGRERIDSLGKLKGRKLSPENIAKRKITLSLQPIRKCTYCDKYGKGSSMTRYHFDNCKHKSNI